MTEVPILLKNPAELASSNRRLVVEVDAAEAFTVFPSMYRYPAGRRTVEVMGDGAGNLSFMTASEEWSEPMMALFCHVGGTITFTSEGAIAVKGARVVDADGSEVEDAVLVFEEGVGTSGVSTELPVKDGRAVALVTVRSSCQLSLDATQEGERRSSFGLTIDHRVEEGYANVFFERHHEGRWLPESRVKLGFLSIAEGSEYTLSLMTVPEDRDDDWSHTVRVFVSVSGSVARTLRDLGRVSGGPIVGVVARESGRPGGAGCYEVKGRTPVERGSA
jgi:hypothetical protein